MTNVSILTQEMPTEIWTSLDWSLTTSFHGAALSWEACPLLAQSTQAQTADYFLGTGRLTYCVNNTC